MQAVRNTNIYIIVTVLIFLIFFCLLDTDYKSLDFSKEKFILFSISWDDKGDFPPHSLLSKEASKLSIEVF